jgi:hypothetical protein
MLEPQAKILTHYDACFMSNLRTGIQEFLHL